MNGRPTLLQDFIHWTRVERNIWLIPILTAIAFLMGLLFLTRSPGAGPPLFPSL
ncbi:MAG: hypothetical protein HBSAPP02_30520 [Phycisphaerae bacterium]|nr:MAG: hypothetical protein HBSAPP02_30520 [Phycisphaerae bacterium]